MAAVKPPARPFDLRHNAVFLVGCAAYVLNRWMLKDHVPSTFLHSYFDDLWLIPCALPPLLVWQRAMGWRDGSAPGAREIALHVALWSLLFEGLGPRFVAGATADGWDVVCYAAGGLGAWLYWHRGRIAALRGFDVLAPHYRWMEAATSGPLLQRCRTAFIADVVAARRVLLLGAGRGRFLFALLRSAPDADITIVESSAAMVACMRAELRAQGLSERRVTFVQVDARTWDGGRGGFDVVASHFFLDCFTPDQLAALIPHIAAFTTPEARWVVSDFALPPGGWRRVRARFVHGLMYAFFRAVANVAASRLTPPDGLLRAAGFRLAARRHINWGLLQADLWTRRAQGS